jgi:exodeoxyribonuclease X
MNIWVVDVETTGLDHATDRVVEFAAVPVEVKAPVDQVAKPEDVAILGGYSSLVFPARLIPPESSAVHHIIDEDVVEAPPLGRAVDRVLGPLWRNALDRVFVAHVARFDRNFLPMLHDDARWVDTHRCALHIFPDAPNHKNQTFRYLFKFDVPRDLNVHRALGDATVTAHLFARLLQERPLAELFKLSTKPVILKTLPFGKHRGELWTEVPSDYLDWMIRENMDTAEKQDDPDVRHTLKQERARRAAIDNAKGN